jgi:pimeloyl-ACP methyl ester carboxylesterase
MLGYGLSDKPKNFNYTIIGHAETAFSLLSTLQVESYHLLCHDLGDSICQQVRHIACEPHGLC